MRQALAQQFDRRTAPQEGEAVLLCEHSQPLYPHEQGSADLWFVLTKPVEIPNPSAPGNIDVKWLACCLGCFRAAKNNELAVDYTKHAFLGPQMERGRWVSDADSSLFLPGHLRPETRR